MKILICVLIGLVPVFGTPAYFQNVCGYAACPGIISNKLNIHIVPHSHDDVGWLKTVDQYYYGTRNNIQHAGVQYILDSVLQALLQHPDRRFIQVETAFFWKWWQEQTDEIRGKVQSLVDSGRLEIIGGAWSMNDEAAVHYQSTIDQFTWGFRKLDETLGRCAIPKIGWQIDPFGHSREQASLFAQMGFDGLFFARLDYRDKARRLATKNAEFIWQGSPNLGASSRLFTHVLYNHYMTPPGFCFDVMCPDTPIVDNTKSREYNAPSKAREFLVYVYKQALHYKTNNVIMTMGGDFHYQDALSYFLNMDKLMKAMRIEDPNINVFYSTPSCYLKAVNDANETFSIKTDDFFPYASDAHSYWTGYFTSRPTSKRMERLGNNLLQVQKIACQPSNPRIPIPQITYYPCHLNATRPKMAAFYSRPVQSCSVLQGLKWDEMEHDKLYSQVSNQLRVTKQLSSAAFYTSYASTRNLNPLREAMGVMQHHDAITGTEKQHVADDYGRLLHEAMETSLQQASDSLRTLLQEPSNEYKSCLWLNISQCDATEGSNKFLVTIYNPLSRPVDHYVRLPVPDTDYKVYNALMQEIEIQVVKIFDMIANMPGRASIATHEIVFKAKNIPPLGTRVFYVEYVPGIKVQYKRKFQNYHITLGLNRKAEISFHSIMFDNKVLVTPEIGYYFGESGDDTPGTSPEDSRASGAYIFRPHGTKANIIKSLESYETNTGPIVFESYIRRNSWLGEILRLYDDAHYIEYQWIVGPIPKPDEDDAHGKEVIMRYSSDVASDGVFYTDSNGREMLQRIRDRRPDYNLTNEEPISRNYYPVTAKITLSDQESQFSVLNDRAQAGSSLENGAIELMVHRRLFRDDGFGVQENLNEEAFGTGLIATGKHYIIAGPKSGITGVTQTAEERFLAQKIHLAPWMFITPLPDTYDKNYKSLVEREKSILASNLPENIQILTMEPWDDNEILLRLEHIFEKNEDEILSQPLLINLENMFSSFKVKEVREMNLGANQYLNEVERLKWLGEDGIEMISPKYREANVITDSDMLITLHPMEIKTFLIVVQ